MNNNQAYKIKNIIINDKWLEVASADEKNKKKVWSFIFYF
jgi:hypothetical protein